MDNEFREFWMWLLDEAFTHTVRFNNWSGRIWLDKKLKEWKQMPVCECGHRRTNEENIRSKAVSCILESIVTCANCGKLIKTTSHRDSIIKFINNNPDYVYDWEKLNEEIGYKIKEK